MRLPLLFPASGSVSRKDLAAVCKRHVTASVPAVGTVFGHICLNRDLISDFQCMPVPTCSGERVHAHQFEVPIRHSAFVVFHVDVEPNMRVCPFEPRDDSF